ncbi:MAG: AAA family ATPase [Pseudomonadota bacterium]
MAEIIAFCNQKGGVGKTTTAINVAACMAAAEQRTLLVDLDPQGNSTTGFGFNKYNIERSVYHAFTSDQEIRDLLIETQMPFLKILPSNTELVGADIELVDYVSRETILKTKLSAIQDEFDFILIDCPPSLNLLTINALSAANSVIIPVQCEYYAMEGLADLQRTIGFVQERVNPELKISGIVLTMFDSRNNMAHQVSQEINNHFNELVFKTIIPRNIRLSEAPSHGKPILLYDVSSKGSVSYFDLTDEILSRYNKTT